MRAFAAWAREGVRSLVQTCTWNSPARGVLLAWAVFYALYGLWIFVRTPGHMPLLVTANILLHEAGHPAFSVFGRTAMFYGGTIFQLAFPLAALWTFFARREMQGVAFAIFWLGSNLIYVGIYMADARAGVLPLIGGGEHDFEFIFGQLGLLEWDTTIGLLTRVLGWLTMAAAPALMARYLWVQRSGASPRVELASSVTEPSPRPRPRPGKSWGSE